MIVLVTGSNGFIGSNICKYLKSKGHRVFGLDCAEKNDYLDLYMKADITDSVSVKKAECKFGKCDIIVHAAANLNKDEFDNEVIKVNCIGINNILKLAIQLSCSKIINISGITAIGKPVYLPITEEHPVNPETLYHITKAVQEMMINRAVNYGMIPINLRVPSPIGTGMNHSTILPVFLKKCKENSIIEIAGKGTRRQNYIDVRDIASAVEKCIISDSANGCYNIASLTTISNFDLALKCRDMTNSVSEIVFKGEDKADNVVWDISIEKALRELNFKPQYFLDDTITNMLAGGEY